MAGELPPRRVLLVEGVDDRHVVRHLRDRHSDVPQFEIIYKGGFPALVGAIGPEIKASGRLAVGILADANDNPAGRWQAIADRLRRTQVTPPARMETIGAIAEGRPRVGIWLMPDNGSAGELEDFVAKLIPDGDPVWPRARSYVDDIPVAERKFAAGKVLRARVHAWLAARAEPRLMGAAIGAGDLDAAAPLAKKFADWLRSVFR